MVRMRASLRLAVAFGLAVFGGLAARADDAAGNSDLVKRGEYLMRAGDCVACHTDPGGGQPFAGGRRMDTPFGPIYTPNITPDKETGIGNWSDDEFYRALHEGIGKKGEYLYPVFPFPWYTNVTRDDALAIKAYLFAQKPVHSEDKGDKFYFPFNIRTAMITWRTLFFKAGKADNPGAKPDADPVARGSYLVEALGHCGECHNRRNVLGASDWSGKFEGGAIEGWYAPNITSDGKQGVGSWSEDEIAKFLKSGIAPHSNIALGPMQETIMDSTSYLKEEDLHAIAAYIKSIKPKETFKNNEGGYAEVGAPGETLYQNHCASCHGLKGQGLEGRVPALAGNGAVVARGPENVIQVVLGGLPAKSGLAPMPAVGANISDGDIAQIADYVRNAFGNAAPANTNPNVVGKLREKISSPMLGNQKSDCAGPSTEEVKALQPDITKLAQGKDIDLLPGIDALVSKLKPSDPKQASALVADMTSAYCTAMFDGGGVPQPKRAADIGKFSVLAYSQLQKQMSP